MSLAMTFLWPISLAHDAQLPLFGMSLVHDHLVHQNFSLAHSPTTFSHASPCFLCRLFFALLSLWHPQLMLSLASPSKLYPSRCLLSHACSLFLIGLSLLIRHAPIHCWILLPESPQTLAFSSRPCSLLHALSFLLLASWSMLSQSPDRLFWYLSWMVDIPSSSRSWFSPKILVIELIPPSNTTLSHQILKGLIPCDFLVF